MAEQSNFSKSIYYYANQVYEYSFIKSIYSKIGGTFLVRKTNRRMRVNWYFRQSQRKCAISSSFKKQPNVLVKNVNNIPFDLPGTVISNSNTVIQRNKNISNAIFMGHGTGDKRYGGDAHALESFDYHFISGPKHMEKLKDSNVKIPDKNLVKIGNARFDEIVNSQIDISAYENYLGIKDKNRKTILYAPTWKWGAGTLHKYGYWFCREVTKEHNLIIRPHYFDRKYIPKFKLWAKLKGLKHIYFSNPANILSNDTMFDFAVSDLLISDTSSILYEYLITRNPIIVVDTEHVDLHKMLPEMDITTIANKMTKNDDILKLIEKVFVYHDTKNFDKMLNNCFYYNDGKSVERISNFLSSPILSQS
jgi:CDP-glycerol glycerophosphotransferase (TagB/SpsB family)